MIILRISSTLHYSSFELSESRVNHLTAALEEGHVVVVDAVAAVVVVVVAERKHTKLEDFLALLWNNFKSFGKKLDHL